MNHRPERPTPRHVSILGLIGIVLAAGAIVASGIGRSLLLATACLALLAALVAQVVATRRLRLRHRRQRRQAESAMEDLRREASVQTAVLAWLDIGIAVFGGDRLVYANEQAHRELGENLAGVHSPMPGAVKGVIAAARRQPGPAGARYETGHPTRIIAATAEQLEAEDVLILRLADITDRARTEAVRRDFVAAASHELKTPAAAIQAAAETVLMALDDDEEAVREFSGRIYDNAFRLSRIVSDLLDLSRLESDGHSFEPLDLADVVQEVHARLSTTARTVEIHAPPTPLWGSRADLALAISNLLDNAIRYTAPDGHIRVTIGGDDEDVCVEVADDGAGIPRADLPRIFERFYRVDAGRSRSTGGTGLGLAIVKHVAEQHGGRVEAISELGEGSTFRMILPRHAGRPPAD